MYKLAIDNIVEVPVKFTLKAGVVNKLFSVTLQAKRLTQDEITSQFEACEHKYKPFLAQDELVTGWTGNRLVLDPITGEPADFSPEAFDALLGISGVAKLCFDAYILECGAKVKN